LILPAASSVARDAVPRPLIAGKIGSHHANGYSIPSRSTRFEYLTSSPETVPGPRLAGAGARDIRNRLVTPRM
jgi:hypothetical protein